LGIPAVISVFLGALLIEYIPINESEVLINAAILLIALYSISPKAKSIQQTNTNLYIGGGVSGFLAGLIGTGGAIRGLVLTAFNLEKEAKIINPHKMDMKTTTKDTFKFFAVEPKKKELRKYDDEGKPILAQSSYQNAYPNWRNGNKDIFHEKHPQYPFYSLPFKGESNYKQSFTEE
jgi:hypothetical protein